MTVKSEMTSRRTLGIRLCLAGAWFFLPQFSAAQDAAGPQPPPLPSLLGSPVALPPVFPGDVRLRLDRRMPRAEASHEPRATPRTTPTVQVVQVVPSSGTNPSSIFRFDVVDSAGFQDLSLVEAMFSAPFSSYDACFVTMGSNEQLWLMNETGTAWLGPVEWGVTAPPPAPPTTLQNSRCTLNATDSSVQVAGNTLYLYLSIRFGNFGGTKGVYGYAESRAGSNSGWTQLGTSGFSYANPPQVTSVSPSNGSGNGTYQLQVCSPNGPTDLSLVEMIFNTSVSGVGGCLVAYDVPTRTLWLAQEYANWLGPVSPGTSVSLSNNYCTLSAAGTSGSTDPGNQTCLLWNAQLSFPSSFTGTKNIYGYAETVDGLNSLWQTLGTWAPVP
jgi:hypothetical protein